MTHGMTSVASSRGAVGGAGAASVDLRQRGGQMAVHRAAAGEAAGHVHGLLRYARRGACGPAACGHGSVQHGTVGPAAVDGGGAPRPVSLLPLCERWHRPTVKKLHLLISRDQLCCPHKNQPLLILTRAANAINNTCSATGPENGISTREKNACICSLTERRHGH